MDSHYLKISGKAELPHEIDIGFNFHVSLEGSVTSVTKSDNDDGSYTHAYKFVPIKVELLTPKGKTLKLKDTRGHSAIFRAKVWKEWSKGGYPEDFDVFYENLMNRLIHFTPEIVGMYGTEKP